jgi:hypothetical protein
MAKENRGSNKSKDSQKASAVRKDIAERRDSKNFTNKSNTHLDGRGQSGHPKKSS